MKRDKFNADWESGQIMNEILLRSELPLHRTEAK